MVTSNCLQKLQLSGSLFVLLAAFQLTALSQSPEREVAVRWQCKKSHSNLLGLGNRHG
jgi:hypothetical protein